MFGVDRGVYCGICIGIGIAWYAPRFSICFGSGGALLSYRLGISGVCPEILRGGDKLRASAMTSPGFGVVALAVLLHGGRALQ